MAWRRRRHIWTNDVYWRLYASPGPNALKKYANQIFMAMELRGGGSRHMLDLLADDIEATPTGLNPVLLLDIYVGTGQRTAVHLSENRYWWIIYIANGRFTACVTWVTLEAHYKFQIQGLLMNIFAKNIPIMKPNFELFSSPVNERDLERQICIGELRRNIYLVTCMLVNQHCYE